MLFCTLAGMDVGNIGDAAEPALAALAVTVLDMLDICVVTRKEFCESDLERRNSSSLGLRLLVH